MHIHQEKLTQKICSDGYCSEHDLEPHEYGMGHRYDDNHRHSGGEDIETSCKVLEGCLTKMNNIIKESLRSHFGSRIQHVVLWCCRCRRCRSQKLALLCQGLFDCEIFAEKYRVPLRVREDRESEPAEVAGKRKSCAPLGPSRGLRRFWRPLWSRA